MSVFISVFTGSCFNDNPRLSVSVAVQFSGKKPVSGYFLYKKDMSSQLADLISVKIAVDKFNSDKVVYAKNIYAVNSFGLWLRKWKENKWSGKDNKPIKNKDVIKYISDKTASSQLFFSVELSKNGEQIIFCSHLAKAILTDILSGKTKVFEPDVIYPINLPEARAEIIDI